MGHPPGEARESAVDVSVRVDDVELLLAVVMRAATAPGATEARIRSVFAGVQPLFGNDFEFQLHLGTKLDREPAPLLLDRMWYGDVYDRIEPRPHAIFQKHMDEHSFALRMRVERARRSTRRAFTSTMEELIGNERAVRIRQDVLQPIGFSDVLLSDWLASPDRMLTLNTVRKSEGGFTTEHRVLASLLTCALGPMIELHVASLTPSRLALLSCKQLSTLRALLVREGDIDEQALARLLIFFGERDREGLITRFVSPEHVEEIEELIRLSGLEESDWP